MYAREVTIRIGHEAKLLDQNWFVTFTFDDDHISPIHSLDTRIHTLLVKRLRYYYPDQPVRFVASWEYGATTSRPHAHFILLGMEITDAVPFKTNDKGDPLYTSETMQKAWGMGEVILAPMTPQTARYVASHNEKNIKAVGKKFDIINGKKVRREYTAIDPYTGETHIREYPFMRYSTKPGIGYPWYEKYHTELRHGHLIVDGKKEPVPGYYMRLLKNDRPDIYEKVKAERLEFIMSEQAQYEQTDRRLDVRQVCQKATLKQRRRGTIEKPVPTQILLPTYERKAAEKTRREAVEQWIEEIRNASR